MARLNVSIFLASPLLTGETRHGDVYQSLGYLPGSVLRGAVVSHLMRQWSADEKRVPHPQGCPDRSSCSFCQLFYPLEGQAPRFYDCYPAMPGDDSVLPFPHTARTCKRAPGFIRPEDSRERHGVVDTLLAQVAARDAAGQGGARTYQCALRCPTCDQEMEAPSAGHYGVYEDTYYSARPIIRRFSRTAINRRRQTAQDGQLFTLSVMSEQMKTGLPKPQAQAATHFSGFVDCDEAQVRELRQVLRQLPWLGSGTSRGMGQLDRVDVSSVDSPETPDDTVLRAVAGLWQSALEQGLTQAGHNTENDLPVLARLLAFNQAIVKQRAFYQEFGLSVLPGRWYFTIDLLAETFVRHQGLPALKLTAEMLGLNGAVLDFMAAEAIDRGGWSTAWGLPRSRQIGLAPGAVFLFRVDNDDPALIRQLLHRLLGLEREGIGQDRERGAGRLMVCAPFHEEVTPR